MESPERDRSIRWAAGGGGGSLLNLPPAEQVRAHDLIGDVIPLRDEPRAAGDVEPPLALGRRFAATVEDVVRPLPVRRGGRVRHVAELAAISEFLYRTRAIDRTGQNLHDDLRSRFAR